MTIDKFSLAIAARRVAPTMTYAAAMANPAIRKVIEAKAKKHQQAMQNAADVKKKQANDED